MFCLPKTAWPPTWKPVVALCSFSCLVGGRLVVREFLRPRAVGLVACWAVPVGMAVSDPLWIAQDMRLTEGDRNPLHVVNCVYYAVGVALCRWSGRFSPLDRWAPGSVRWWMLCVGRGWENKVLLLLAGVHRSLL